MDTVETAHRRFYIPFLFAFFATLVCAHPIKIATYNIYFLDDGISPERKAHLQQVLADLDADVIGFEEIGSLSALTNILSPDYRIAMIDNSLEVQETALAVRKPLKIRSAKYVFPGEAYDDAFPRGRDLLQVEVEAYGVELVFLVDHAKSRWGGRERTDPRREKAARLMVDYIRHSLAGRKVILLGDFNDSPDDRSLNILEYGNPEAPAGIDALADTFLYNTTEQLWEKDDCSIGLFKIRQPDADTFSVRVPGAREENNRWRGKVYNYREDVKIKAILIDQILVSMNLKPTVWAVGIFHKSEAIRGDLSRIKFDHGELRYTHRGSLASDHLPVWAELEIAP